MKQRRTLETNQVDATGLKEMEEQAYTTDNGNRIRFYMWKFAGGQEGAWILGIEWSGADPTDRLPDASNTNDRFLWGTVLNSPSPGVVTITNPFLGQTIALDMSDPRRPRHISEHGDVEAAGANEEVWVDFDWKGVDAETGATLLPYRRRLLSTLPLFGGRCCCCSRSRRSQDRAGPHVPTRCVDRRETLAPFGADRRCADWGSGSVAWEPPLLRLHGPPTRGDTRQAFLQTHIVQP